MTFQPGKSGNPAGRPKLDPRIREMFEAKGEEAFNVIVKHMDSEDERISLAAAGKLVDRAYGKPAQQIDHGNADEEGFRVVTRIENVIVKPNPTDSQR